jgi:hypothetical protein
MGGAVPPLPQYAFLAWCSVRGSTGTHTYWVYTSSSVELRRVFKDAVVACFKTFAWKYRVRHRNGRFLEPLKFIGVFAQEWRPPWRRRVQKVISFVVYFNIIFLQFCKYSVWIYYYCFYNRRFLCRTLYSEELHRTPVEDIIRPPCQESNPGTREYEAALLATTARRFGRVRDVGDRNEDGDCASWCPRLVLLT